MQLLNNLDDEQDSAAVRLSRIRTPTFDNSNYQRSNRSGGTASSHLKGTVGNVTESALKSISGRSGEKERK